MRLWKSSLVALMLLTLVAAIPVAADPPAAVSRHQFRTDGLPVSGPMEMIRFVNDFAPGAATPPHTHPGLLIATVLEGALTFSQGGVEKVYGPGESFAERPNEGVGLARNATAGHTLAMVSVLVPKGAPPSTPQPGGPSPAPPAPTTLYLTRADAIIPTGAYEVAHNVNDLVPGAQNPLHIHQGQVFITVLEGAITVSHDGGEKVYGVGESFVEVPNEVGQVFNRTGGKTTLLVTHVLPKGAPFLNPVAAPAAAAPGAGAPSAPPRTGGGREAAFIRRLGDG